MQDCTVQAAFTVWWRNGKILKAQTKAKRKMGFCQQKRGNNEASHGVRPQTKILVYEMRKKQ